jgi:hypothetical protein
MADILGALATAAVFTIGTTTVYTCPTGKTARVKIMYTGVAGVNSTLKVNVASMEVLNSGALTAGNRVRTDSTRMMGTGLPTADTGGSDTTTVAPGPKEYFLKAGDTVTYTIGTADFASMFMQVSGAELDAS